MDCMIELHTPSRFRCQIASDGRGSDEPNVRSGGLHDDHLQGRLAEAYPLSLQVARRYHFCLV